MASSEPSQQSSSSPSAFPHGEFLPAGAPHLTQPPLPPTHPTIGYKLNHFMLRIRDPKPSLDFYINLMGMRSVFVMNVGPFTIYYLGYPQTDEHRSDLTQFGQDTCAKLQHTLGLLELYHVHGTEGKDEGWYETGNRPPALGFGHLGFTVPDVPAALKRLEENGVKVIKPLGVTTNRSIPISEWEENKGVGVGEIHPNYKAVFDNIAFVQDPDGYIVELVPQKLDPLAP